MEKKGAGGDKTCEYCGVTLYRRKAACSLERLSQCFAVIMLCVFPFLIDSLEHYNKIDLPKSRYVYFCVLTCAYVFFILMIGLGVLLSKRARCKRIKEGVQKLDISQYLMILYVLWAGLSAYLSPYRAGTWIGTGLYEGLFSIILYSLLFILLSFWGEYTNTYIYALTLMSIAVCVLLFLQILGRTPFAPEGGFIVKERIVTFVGDIDCISGIGTMVVPALFCGFILLDSKARYVCLIGFMLYFYLMLFLDVDSGKMGLIAALIVLLPFLLDRWKRAIRTMEGFTALLLTYGVRKISLLTDHGFVLFPNKKILLLLAFGFVLLILGLLLERREHTFHLRARTIRRLVRIILFLVLIAALLLLYSYNGTHQLLNEIHQALHGTLSDTAGHGRGILWKLGIRFIRETPFFGTGPDTYAARVLPYQYEQAFASLREPGDPTKYFVHNDFLQVAVCLGLGGLAIYSAWILSMAVRLLKRAAENPLLLIFGGAMVGYLGHAFFSYSIVLVTPIFWVLAGLGNKCAHQTQITRKID